jgi:hypothetical protein
VSSRADVLRRVGGEPGQGWPAFAWPGGYPIGYVTDDGAVLCAGCMEDPTNPIHFGGVADGWRIEGADVLYEGGEDGCSCAHCARVLVAPDAVEVGS